MISKESYVYGDRGVFEKDLTDDWILLGKIKKEVSQTKPMVKEKTYFVSNTLPIGTEIYKNKKNKKTIYAKYNNIFLKYELIK